MRRVFLLLSLSLYGACEGTPEILSGENGSVTVHGYGIADFGGPILAGTRVCPTIDVCKDNPDCPATAIDCLDQHADGGATIDAEGCLRLPTPGRVNWSFTPLTCDIDPAVYQPVADVIAVDVVDGPEVHGDVSQIEDTVEDYVASGDARLDPPNPDWRNPPGEPYRVVAGSPFQFEPFLALVDGTHVAWPRDVTTFESEVRSGEMSLEMDGGLAVVTLTEGTDADVVLAANDFRFAAAHVLGVGEDAPDSMEIVVGYALDVDSPAAVPFGARAVIRDADGNLLYGAPVEWAVTDGALAVLDPDHDFPGLDYTYLIDACYTRPSRDGTRHAEIAARYDGIEGTAELDWTADVSTWLDDDDIAEMCEGHPGCGCASTGPMPVGTVVFVGVALVLRRRRVAVNADRPRAR